MTVPQLAVVSSAPEAVEADALVIGVRSADEGPALLVPDGSPVGSGLDVGALGATGATGDLVRLPAAGIAAGQLVLVGVGKQVDADALRAAAAVAVRRLAGLDHVALALPADDDGALGAVLEGAALGTYRYVEYRVKSLDAQKEPVARVTAVSGRPGDAAVAAARVTAEAVALVKDLVNAPPNDLDPEALAARAVEAAAGAGLETRVWDEEALAEGGFGGLLGVGSGSVRPPRLVRVGYAPEGATSTVALVGKGITFDSGGLSLKPPASMVGMKYDMTGAATVLAVAVAAARLRLPIGVTAWLCIAENMPSGSAARPNDVLRIRGGRTVEVLNTDAEGRLVLADGIVAACEEAPDAVIDVATLTGAIMVALGMRTVGAMGDDALVERALAAAASAGEPVWHMPLPEELRALLNSDVADIANVKIGTTAGGALIAGHFLREFVGTREDGERIPWLHLDIAGSSNNTGSPYGAVGSGPTGTMVRTLLRLLEALGGTGAPTGGSGPSDGRE